jgi:hypothetical protein
VGGTYSAAAAGVVAPATAANLAGHSETNVDHNAIGNGYFARIPIELRHFEFAD